jgi:hypothetical protein
MFEEGNEVVTEILTNLTVSSRCQDLIRRWLEPNERGANLTVPCASFWSGSYRRDSEALDMQLRRMAEASPTPVHWEYMDCWSNGFRSVYVNHADLAIFTYCEGDLDLTIDADDATFERRLASAAEFYGSH